VSSVNDIYIYIYIYCVCIYILFCYHKLDSSLTFYSLFKKRKKIKQKTKKQTQNVSTLARNVKLSVSWCLTR
jgi:1,4-dihydroxy-2-naphthoate octaprenyltransferase